MTQTRKPSSADSSVSSKSVDFWQNRFLCWKCVQRGTLLPKLWASVASFFCLLIYVLFFCSGSDLSHLRERNVEDLSGGELQRFACAVVCIQRADMWGGSDFTVNPPTTMSQTLNTNSLCCVCVCCSFMFDEPSSYLDVKQRLKAAITIRSLITPDR